MIYNIYEQPEKYTDNQIEIAIRCDDIEMLRKAVIYIAMYSSDVLGAESFCLRLSTHPDPSVKGNAILGWGHLARRFGKLKSPEVKNLVEDALQNPSEYVRQQAWAASDDLSHFLGWNIEGFDSN